ncbi:hypothetical protein [Novosphingobium sp. ST904]|uniref:hypothetical protein n=1 Tax=Novosphingobium sp. ST904 TaxID=1684385 RepID=UPI001E2D8C1B|nr:hypothetical protein [Novosphingobium sp. ST904]
MGSNMINARLVHRFGVDTMLKAGIVWATVSALLIAVTTWTDMGGLPGLVLALFLYISATGLIVANSIAGVLEEAPQGAGAASRWSARFSMAAASSVPR